MTMLQDVRDVTTKLPAQEMLQHLLTERFPGQVAVTASLKSPSIVVLKMIADIDPSTPVIFCQARPVFPESEKYRAEIIGLLGLTNVTIVTQSDALAGKRDCEFSELLWNDAPGGVGKVRETIHLNDTLAPYRCWIRAVYHDRHAKPAAQRIDVYANKVIVDVLRRRNTDLIDLFMQDHKLPHHPRIRPIKKRQPIKQEEGPDIGWHF